MAAKSEWPAAYPFTAGRKAAVVFAAAAVSRLSLPGAPQGQEWGGSRKPWPTRKRLSGFDGECSAAGRLKAAGRAALNAKGLDHD